MNILGLHAVKCRRNILELHAVKCKSNILELHSVKCKSEPGQLESVSRNDDSSVESLKPTFAENKHGSTNDLVRGEKFFFL